MRRAAVALAAVVLLLVAGCGSSSGPASPSDAVKQFIAAVKSADGKKACSLMAPQAQARVVRGNLSCEAAIKQLGPLLALQLRNVKVGAATVHGSSATVPLSTPQRRAVYSLQKPGGRWVIVTLSAR